MDIKQAKQMTAPCGIPCFHCPLHMAKEDAQLRAQLALSFGIPEETATCEGCRNIKGIIPQLNPDKQCEVFRCIQEKGIEFCHECDTFPCERLQPYADKAHFPHNTKMYQLCMMKKLGFETWVQEKAVEIWETYSETPFDFNRILY